MLQTRASLVESVVDSPLAMIITNPNRPDNPVELANQAFYSLTGYSESEAIGRNCRFLSGERTEPWAQNELRKAIRDKRPVLVEILNYRRDGSPFRNGVMVTPLFGEDGELIYFLGSQVDLGLGEPSALSARQARACALVSQLPERQRQVLGAMAKGLLNKQIAHQLNIAEKTVKMHRALMLERLGVATSAEAIRLAVEAGL